MLKRVGPAILIGGMWAHVANIQNLRRGIRPRVHRGQVWQSNDPRRLRAIEIISDPAPHDNRLLVRNVQTDKLSRIRRDQFTTGPRGWSLLKDVQRG